MAAQTINGKPNLFVSPEHPTEKYPSYSERVADFTAIASEMATPETVIDSEAEMLDDPEFQESYNEWCERLEQEWLNDPEAQRKFNEWCDAEERKSELETAENEAYEAHLEEQAETAELARLGDAFMECINGHDLKWQEGIS